MSRSHIKRYCQKLCHHQISSEYQPFMCNSLLYSIYESVYLRSVFSTSVLYGMTASVHLSADGLWFNGCCLWMFSWVCDYSAVIHVENSNASIAPRWPLARLSQPWSQSGSAGCRREATLLLLRENSISSVYTLYTEWSCVIHQISFYHYGF